MSLFLLTDTMLLVWRKSPANIGSSMFSISLETTLDCKNAVLTVLLLLIRFYLEMILLFFFQAKHARIRIVSYNNNGLNYNNDFPEALEPVNLLGYFENIFSFICWDKENLELVEYPTKPERHRILCRIKPTVIDGVGSTVAFLDGINKVIIADFSSGLNIEVTPEHHGLSNIDKVILHEIPITATGKKANRLSLFDYSNRFSVVCSFSLDSLFSWNWRVLHLRKLVLSGLADEPITWLTLHNQLPFSSPARATFSSNRNWLN